MNEKEAKTSIDFVKWFSELNKNSGNIAGGKGANLAEIYNLRLPVPPGFVVTAQAYSYFIEKSGLKEKIKEILEKINYEDTKQLDDSTKEIRNLILKSKMPKEMEKEILESYEILSSSNNTNNENLRFEAKDIINNFSEPSFVAVRSSATTEDLATASFAGQQDSFVNVKGNSQLLEHIKKCFASLFTSRATYYRIKKGFKHEQAQLAVVVQRMVDSDKSGVIFSKDPSYKNENVIIEAVYGLGEGIVSGQISPDNYVVNSKLEIIQKREAEKKIAITRDSGGNKKIVNLSEEKSKSKVLTDFEIKKLAEFALKLEEHYKNPQDIEFAIENESIYIVQTRPITTIEKRFENTKEIKGEIILTGIPASPGIASGKIKIVNSLEDLQKIKTGDVLVTKMTNPDMVVTMQKSSAIVTDEGGMTAHASIVSREMGIPCIVGTQEATTKLKEGEIITVDGFSGKVYKGKVSETIEKEVLPIKIKTRTKIKVIVDLPTYAERASKSGIKEVGLTRIEGIIAESGKHPNYFIQKKNIKEYENLIFKGIEGIAKYFDELWIRTSDIRTDEFQNLEGSPKNKEANPMLGMHGIRFSLKNIEILKAELNALKRISEKGKTIGLLLPQIISVEEVMQIKEILSQINFKNAKVGVMIETPASVQIIKELCEEGIDFISFGTNDLTQYTLAIDRGNESVQYLYNEMHPSILHQLESVIKICKEFEVETSICGQAGSKKEMVDVLVRFGINSISVNADMAKEISDFVYEIEKELREEESGEISETTEDNQDKVKEIKEKQENNNITPNNQNNSNSNNNNNNSNNNNKNSQDNQSNQDNKNSSMDLDNNQNNLEDNNQEENLDETTTEEEVKEDNEENIEEEVKENTEEENNKEEIQKKEIEEDNSDKVEEIEDNNNKDDNENNKEENNSTNSNKSNNQVLDIF